MISKQHYQKFSAISLFVSLSALVLYSMFSDAKIYPYSIQFKIFSLLTFSSIIAFLLGLVFLIIQKISDFKYILILMTTSLVIACNLYISYQTIVNFITPSEHELAANNIFTRIKNLQTFEIGKISFYEDANLNPETYLSIKDGQTKEELLLTEIQNTQNISQFLEILKNCSFDRWPRYKRREKSFYVILSFLDNSKYEFRISLLKDTENQYEISSIETTSPNRIEYYGATYTDKVHNWFKEY